MKHSYPVAGTLPFYLRSDSQRDWGDFEQNMPNLYNIANYLEFYMLGAYGEGRMQLLTKATKNIKYPLKRKKARAKLSTLPRDINFLQ